MNHTRDTHRGGSALSSQRRRRRANRPILATLYLAPVVLLFSVFAYLPFFRAIWLSLHITDATGAPTRFNSLTYYGRILGLDGRTEYLESLALSLRFSVIVVPFSLLGGLALALLAMVRLRGIRVFRTLFTSSLAISLSSASVMWAMIFSPSFGLTNWLVAWLGLPSPGLLANASTALFALAAMSVWSNLGFCFLVALAGLQAIPQDLYDSVRVDGATPYQTFVALTLPLLGPTLLFLLIIMTIQSLQAFTQFHVLMQGPGPEGATNVLTYATFAAFWIDNRYGFASALSLVLFLLLLVLSLLQYRTLEQRTHYQ